MFSIHDVFIEKSSHWKLRKICTLHNVGGPYLISWEPQEKKDWGCLTKREFGQQGVLGLKLQYQLFCESPSAGLLCRFWTCKPPQSHKPISYNSLSLSPRSQHCFHWRDQRDCLLWNRWTLCEARVYRCAELAYVGLSFSRHCALPLNWVGERTKISQTWTLCSKVYSLPVGPWTAQWVKNVYFWVYDWV